MNDEYDIKSINEHTMRVWLYAIIPVILIFGCIIVAAELSKKDCVWGDRGIYGDYYYHLPKRQKVELCYENVLSRIDAKKEAVDKIK